MSFPTGSTVRWSRGCSDPIIGSSVRRHKPHALFSWQYPRRAVTNPDPSTLKSLASIRAKNKSLLIVQRALIRFHRNAANIGYS
jgi:hypothetical protein